MEGRPIPSREGISIRPFGAWQNGPTPEQANQLIGEVPVPGGIGLRSRFMLLVDPQGTYPAGAFALDWQTWKRQIELVDAADAGLVAHDKAAVAAATKELMATHRMGLHPLPIVDALVADGEIARQEDEPATAIILLDEARKTAAAAGYPFGYMRATLSLGYVTVQTGSADDALLLFDEAGRLAADLDDRVLRGGALVGKGEAHDRAGRLDGAIAATALDLAEEHGPWVATVNALDGVGEIDLSDGDVDSASAITETHMSAAIREVSGMQRRPRSGHVRHGRPRPRDRNAHPGA